MPSADVITQFAFASLLLALAPGPSAVLAATIGAEHGRGAGLAAAIGLGLGILPWGGLVASGLSALLTSGSGPAVALRVAGGCYLLWMAWRAWPRSSTEAGVGDTSANSAAGQDASMAGQSPTDTQSRVPTRPLRDGIVVNLTNPTLVPFLGSVLPPFIVVPGPPAGRQAFLLVLVLALVSTVVNAGWSLGGATAGRRLRGGPGHLAGRLAAVMYLGLAVFVMVSGTL